jgi:hypothetical protein
MQINNEYDPQNSVLDYLLIFTRFNTFSRVAKRVFKCTKDTFIRFPCRAFLGCSSYGRSAVVQEAYDEVTENTEAKEFYPRSRHSEWGFKCAIWQGCLGWVCTYGVHLRWVIRSWSRGICPFSYCISNSVISFHIGTSG